MFTFQPPLLLLLLLLLCFVVFFIKKPTPSLYLIFPSLYKTWFMFVYKYICVLYIYIIVLQRIISSLFADVFVVYCINCTSALGWKWGVLYIINEYVLVFWCVVVWSSYVSVSTVVSAFKCNHPPFVHFCSIWKHVFCTLNNYNFYLSLPPLPIATFQFFLTFPHFLVISCFDMWVWVCLFSSSSGSCQEHLLCSKTDKSNYDRWIEGEKWITEMWNECLRVIFICCQILMAW